MITKIKIKNFKKFREFELELDNNVTLLVGPNNGGKTTTLQAISLWAGLINLWNEKKGTGSRSTATLRTGATITRNELSLVPVREMKYLWHKTLTQGDKSTRYTISLEAEGINEGKEWSYGIEATYTGPQTLSCKPLEPTKSIPDEALNVFHLPPLSGVQTQEQKLELGAQKTVVGEGRPGEILRNLLLEVQGHSKWGELSAITKELFDVDLARINFNPASDAYIFVDYQLPRSESYSKSILEIATAGSGFLQFLLISSVLFNNPKAILLLDEPDSHMHSLLQRGMYDWVTQHAQLSHSQLVVSTHSEVLINTTPIEKIKGIFHDQVSRFPASQDLGQALKILKPLDLLNASLKQSIFFAEGDTDLRIIRAWARILEHPVEAKLSDVFFIPTGCDDIKEARDKFKALKPIEPSLRAIYLRDRDATTAASQLPPDFTQYNWKRYEIENYLIVPDSLVRFVLKKGIGNLFATTEKDKAQKYLQDHLPPAYYSDPITEDFDSKGSNFLEKFLATTGIKINKGEYWQIAELMEPEELSPEIKEFLDLLDTVI